MNSDSAVRLLQVLYTQAGNRTTIEGMAKMYLTSKEIVAQHVVPLVEQGCTSFWGISLMHESGVSSYGGSDAAFEAYP
jgi:hypothetical protein